MPLVDKAASDLDLGHDDETRQTGAYFLYFHFIKNKGTGVIFQGRRLWKLLVETKGNESKIITCLPIYFRTCVRWCGGKEGWAERA